MLAFPCDHVNDRSGIILLYSGTFIQTEEIYQDLIVIINLVSMLILSRDHAKKRVLNNITKVIKMLLPFLFRDLSHISKSQ